MPLRDLEAQSASLDNDYGTTRGPNAADSHQVALLDGDGAELTSVTAPGYARGTLLPAAWTPADEGSKSGVTTFGAPTGEWVPAVSFRLIGDDGNVWDELDLLEPLLVTGASPVGPQVRVTVFYDPTA